MAKDWYRVFRLSSPEGERNILLSGTSMHVHVHALRCECVRAGTALAQVFSAVAGGGVPFVTVAGVFFFLWFLRACMAQ